MTKRGVRVVITGKPRPEIDVEAMVQIIIAMGREIAAGKKVKTASKSSQREVASP